MKHFVMVNISFKPRESTLSACVLFDIDFWGGNFFPLHFLWNFLKHYKHKSANFRGNKTIKQEHQLNGDITDKEVRLIGENGEQLGVVSSREANRLADEAGLDLVKISPNAVPPVCKIMDYGKFIYDKAKREKEARKNQKIVEIKEVQLSMTIEQHDIDIKAKNATKFLTGGNKVRVVLRMRGRQLAYSAKGIEIVNNFCAQLESVSVKDKEPKVEGRNVVVVLNPKNQK